MELPKQYDPAAAQKKWSKFWDEQGFFHSEPNPEKKPYTIVIPPPNVTGALHLGHALNNTLQDMMIRMKRMQGFETLWVPGVDHAGIATQAVVERQLFEEEKKTRHDIGREALVQRIWDWKEQYQKRILSQLKEMGCSCDWERTRFTLDEMCAKAVRHFFFRLFRDQKIYRGKRLVNWDTHLQTAVSDDEVFYEAVDGHFWYIQYLAASPCEVQQGCTSQGEAANVSVIVATTRPETMLGDTAVAVHPDPEAALDRAIDELHKRIATASEKDKADLQAELDAIERRKTDGTLARLKALAEMAKAGRKVLLPLMNREIPLVLDEWAKPEKGTGCVKITPAHDPNDYEVAVRQGLPMLNILNKDGTLNENAGVYAGLTMRKAREKVVADLEQLGLLVKVEKREIELAHSDRSKTPIEPFLNDQWFVRMEELAQSAMDAVEELRITNYELRDNDKIKIIPSRYTKGYLDWLSEKRDWPIGRQLWWGHRIPIWYCPAKKTADGRRQMAEEGATEDDLKRIFAGRDDIAWQLDSENSVWWICSQTEDLPSELPATSFTLVQEEDVLDTWFSSALWPHSTLGWPDRTAEMEYYYPTSVLITSRDIISLWVARMVLSGLYNTGQKPFHEVYIHPKILDKYGEGMSKSKGNGIDPISVMDKFGADALRFALAYLTTESQDVCLPLDFECPHCGEIVEQTKKNRVLPKIPCPKCKKEFGTQWAKTDEDKVLPPGAVVGERFEVARNFCNKLWNAARFVLMSTKEPERSATSKEPERSETSKEPDVERSATSGSLAEELLLEDRWIFSRLATVTKHVTESLESYRFAEAMRVLYDFAWDEFCSFYVEMVKPRLGGEHHYDAYVTLTSVLDSLLQLLHPVIPFVTEEIWQRLREFDDSRPVSITIAPWPTAYTMWINPAVESQFKKFQEVLRAVRDVRAKQNVPPKTEVSFAVKCDEATAALLKPMEQYFLSMAKAKATAWGPGTQSPALGATVPLSGGMDVYVDLTGLIDVEAERKKLDKEIANLTKFIQSKESKLSNEAFTAKAPADVIAKETESLRDLKSQLKTALEALERVTKNENPLF